MRTATPFVTWSVMTDCDPAATSAAISTPSFIGPGCMTSAPGFAVRRRAAVSPYRAAYSRSEGSSPASIRSRWMRRAMTTSASRSASSIEVVTWNRRPAAAPRAAQASKPRSSVAGPHSHRSAPAAVSVQMFERATRECRTSPRITTLRPARDASPVCDRIVYRSSRAWVGWACQPSPPLSTEPPKISAARYGAPLTLWRITSIWAPSASTVRTVSTSDSPFDTDDEAAAMLTTSAERFLAATSKLTRVRVDAS